jgi:hypothetical protein
LPRRAPLGPLLVDHDQGDDEDDEDERNAAPPQAPQATIATILGQVMQMVQVFTQMSAGANPAKLGAVVVETAKVMETIGATASVSAAPPPATDEPTFEGDVDARAANVAPRESTKPRPGPSAAATVGPLAADPAVQFQQIMAALTPEEQEQVQYVITTLSVRALMQWYEELARTTVADGIAKIRAELARFPRERAA